MKIAIFTETFLPQTNGVVRTIERIVKHLEANGHEVLLLTLGAGEPIYSNTKVVRIAGINFSLYPELNLVKPEDPWLQRILENDVAQIPLSLLQSLIPAKHSVVEAELAEFKPDLIHLATPATLGSIGAYYVEKLKTPCLSTFHTDLAAYATLYQVPYMEEIINAATKLVYSRTNRILAPSPSSKKQLEAIGLKNVGVFGRGVDAALFNPARQDKNILKEFNLSPELITLLYTGRLAEEKSIPELISAFKKLQEKYPVQLLMIGNGPLREKLENDLQGTNNFAFTGLQTGEKLAALYASSDIFAFPSRTETFGQVVLEAMSSGLPVVGYDSPGVRDLVEDTKTGLLAKTSDEFYLALEKLLVDSKSRTQYGKQARINAQARSWNNILDDLVKEYEILIKN